MKYSEVPEGAIFFIEGIYEYPKRKVGNGHIDIRDGCKNTSGNPDWDVVTATRIAQLEAQLAEAVNALSYLANYKNYSSDGYVKKTDDEPVHVTEFVAEFLKERDTK